MGILWINSRLLLPNALLLVFGIRLYQISQYNRLLLSLHIKNSDSAAKSCAVLYVHVEKTGGTSISALFYDLFHSQSRTNELEIFLDYPRGNLLMTDYIDIFDTQKKITKPRAQQYLSSSNFSSRDVLAELRSGIRPPPVVVAVHPTMNVSTNNGVDEWKRVGNILRRQHVATNRIVQLFTVLRNPADRIVSHWYYFDRGNREHPHDMPIEEWAQYVHDLGSLYLSRFADVLFRSMESNLKSRATPKDIQLWVESNQEGIKRAISTLQVDFDIVARTECLNQAVAMLGRKVYPTAKSQIVDSKSRYNVGKVANSKRRPLEGEYARVLKSPAQGGLVVDYYIYSALFEAPEHGKPTTCLVGRGRMSGIRVRDMDMALLSST